MWDEADHDAVPGPRFDAITFCMQVGANAVLPFEEPPHEMKFDTSRPRKKVIVGTNKVYCFLRLLNLDKLHIVPHTTWNNILHPTSSVNVGKGLSTYLGVLKIPLPPFL